MSITGGFGMTADLKSGTTRKWVMGRDGVKRWADNGAPCEPNREMTMQFDDWYGRQNHGHIDEISARRAWDALLNEIRPLVADMHSYADLDDADDLAQFGNCECGECGQKIRLHNAAIKCLRELVREGE